jgi:hypothetical protein
MTDIQAITPGDPAMLAPPGAEENGPAAKSRHPYPSRPTGTDVRKIYDFSRQAETEATDPVYPAQSADSPVPYTLTARAEALLEEGGSPTTVSRLAHAGGMAAHDPQAESGLGSQACTYVTEISVPSADSGICRLHVRMKEPGPEPQAEL